MHDRNPGGVCNRELPATALGDRGGFAPAALQLWERLVAHRAYSTRSGIRLLRVARTVADLNERPGSALTPWRRPATTAAAM